jgi:hypothetical protein
MGAIAATHDGRLRDESDATGRVLVAVEHERVVETMRPNLSCDARIPVGYRRELRLDQFLASRT